LFLELLRVSLYAVVLAIPPGALLALAHFSRRACAMKRRFALLALVLVALTPMSAASAADGKSYRGRVHDLDRELRPLQLSATRLH